MKDVLIGIKNDIEDIFDKCGVDFKNNYKKKYLILWIIRLEQMKSLRIEKA